MPLPFISLFFYYRGILQFNIILFVDFLLSISCFFLTVSPKSCQGKYDLCPYLFVYNLRKGHLVNSFINFEHIFKLIHSDINIYVPKHLLSSCPSTIEYCWHFCQKLSCPYMSTRIYFLTSFCACG